MAYDPTGEWGLRHRVRLAYQAYGDYQSVALILNVSPLVIEDFLESPDYLPTGDDLTNIVENLPNLEVNKPHRSGKSLGLERNLVYDEAPVWSDYLLDALDPPPNAIAFKWHYWAGYAGGALRSSIRYDYPDYDPAEVGYSITSDQPDLLATLVWYVRNPSATP